MKVKEIQFTGRTAPAEFQNLKSYTSRHWSVPIMLPVPIRINNILCDRVQISEYGAFKFPQAKDGILNLTNKLDQTIPVDLRAFKSEYVLVPWGEPMHTYGCSNYFKMYLQDDTIVFDIKSNSSYNIKNKFQFRVEFPVHEHNIVRVYYYHCVSDYATYVGAILEEGNIAEWELKPYQPYMRKGLEFYLAGSDSVTPEEPTIPFEPVPDSPPTPGGIEWETMAEWKEGNEIYQVRKI